jgi:hypothetical protein
MADHPGWQKDRSPARFSRSKNWRAFFCANVKYSTPRIPKTERPADRRDGDAPGDTIGRLVSGGMCTTDTNAYAPAKESS